MTTTEKIENLQDIQIGDILRNKASGNAYVIIEKSESAIIGVRSLQVTNPDEWERIIISIDKP
jgi:hypothetical protein